MKGIVTCATNDPAYASQVDGLVLSLRGAGRYEGGITILSDLPASSFSSETLRTASISAMSPAKRGRYSAIWAKTRIDELTPYDTTLWLDADVLALGPIEDIWGYSSLGDIWMVRDLSANHPGTPPLYPPPAIYFNTGVILWNSCGAFSRLMEATRREWDGTTEDQHPLARAQVSTGIVPGELPWRYNMAHRVDGLVFFHAMGHSWPKPV